MICTFGKQNVFIRSSTIFQTVKISKTTYAYENEILHLKYDEKNQKRETNNENCFGLNF